MLKRQRDVLEPGSSSQSLPVHARQKRLRCVEGADGGCRLAASLAGCAPVGQGAGTQSCLTLVTLGHSYAWE